MFTHSKPRRAISAAMKAGSFCGLVRTRSREKNPSGSMEVVFRPALKQVAIDRRGVKARFLSGAAPTPPGPRPTAAATISGAKELSPLSQAIKAALGDLLESEAAPAKIIQVPLPKEGRRALCDLADSLEAAGVTTPEELAKALDDAAPGELRQYSKALWGFLSVTGAVEEGTHDWEEIYGAADRQREMLNAAKAEKPKTEPRPLHKLLMRESLHGRLTRRGKIALAQLNHAGKVAPAK